MTIVKQYTVSCILDIYFFQIPMIHQISSHVYHLKIVYSQLQNYSYMYIMCRFSLGFFVVILLSKVQTIFGICRKKLPVTIYMYIYMQFSIKCMCAARYYQLFPGHIKYFLQIVKCICKQKNMIYERESEVYKYLDRELMICL